MLGISLSFPAVFIAGLIHFFFVFLKALLDSSPEPADPNKSTVITLIVVSEAEGASPQQD